MIFDLALVSLTLALLLWLFSPVLRHRFAQAHEARQVRALFYAQADRLMDDDEFPEMFGEMIVFMSKRVFSRRLLWSFTWHAISGRWVRPQNNVVQGFKAEFQKLPAESQRRLLELVGVFLVALTFNHIILGALWRRVLLVATPESVPPADIRHTEAVLADIGSRDLAAA